MLTVLSIMTLGVIVGYFLRKKTRIVKLNDSFTKWAIYLLLFLLGVAIGNNKDIIGNLHTLGLKAFAISVGAVTGSVLLAWLTYHVFFKNRENEE